MDQEITVTDLTISEPSRCAGGEPLLKGVSEYRVSGLVNGERYVTIAIFADELMEDPAARPVVLDMLKRELVYAYREHQGLNTVEGEQ